MIASSPTPYSLDAHVVVRFPRLTIDAHLQAQRRDVIGVVGANGAGKTTVIRAIAGLEQIDDGRIAINSMVVDDPIADVFVSPQQRRVGVVFQDYRLFPQLSALDNVAFALRCRSVNRQAARATAMQWLERFDLAMHRDHMPATLSGGQSQRVALARALAMEPDILLLDEPLAAIDPDAKSRIRDDLSRYLADFDGATVLISHQHDDIAGLATTAIVLDAGVVRWRGPAEQVGECAAATTAFGPATTQSTAYVAGNDNPAMPRTNMPG